MLVWTYRICAFFSSLAALISASIAIYLNDFMLLIIFLLLAFASYLLIIKAQES